MAYIPITEEVRCVQADGTVFIRSGACNRCGACCRSGDPFSGEQTSPPSPCRMLGEDEKHLAVCTDRTTGVYLNGCASWPSAPGHIVDYPLCSYTFAREE
jgi:hypothetical protein